MPAALSMIEGRLHPFLITMHIYFFHHLHDCKITGQDQNKPGNKVCRQAVHIKTNGKTRKSNEKRKDRNYECGEKQGHRRSALYKGLLLGTD